MEYHPRITKDPSHISFTNRRESSNRIQYHGIPTSSKKAEKALTVRSAMSGK